MPPLQKQVVTAKLGPVDQLRNKKHLVPGQLTDAINVRQVNEFVLGKRYGYSKFDRNASAGAITIGQELASDGSALAMLANSKIWSRSDAHAKWESRGGAERVTCIPSVAINGSLMTKTAIGYASLGGGNGYFYIACEDASGGYRYKIVDAVTGTVIVEGLGGGGGTSSDLRWAKISATKFAVFYATAAQSFSYDVFDPTNVTTAPVTNVLGAFGGGTSVLAKYDLIETTSGLVVGVWSINGTVAAPTANTVALNTINSVTGLPGAWGGFSPAAHIVPCGFARENGTSGFLYIYHTSAAGNLSVRKVDVGTFANPTTTVLGVVAGGTTTAVTGHKEVNGDLTTFYSQPGAGSNPENGFVRRYTMTTAFAVTVATDLRATVLASTSFSLGMSLNGFYAAGQPWYIVTQHDDNLNLQRFYQVRDSTGRIVAKFLYGLGAAYTQSFLTIPCIPPSVSRAVLGLGQNIGASTEFSAIRLDVELAPTIARATAYMGGRRLAWAGGWPARAGGAELLVSELGPSMFPRTVSAAQVVVGSAGLPIGLYQLYATYVQYDADGNATRSSPSAVVTFNLTNLNRNIDVTVPTLRITNDAPSFIELWTTLVGGTIPYLYKRIANDTTVDSLIIHMFDSQPPAVGEILYTFGGEVSNDPPPPCRWSFEWQGRLFLGGTDVRGECWASKQYATEHGPEFSLGLKFVVGAGTGDLTMGCALDDNYALLFRADAIFSISGAGPSNIGQGNYEPVCIEEGDGTTRPGSVVRGKDGVFYQGRDGGIWMIGHDRSRVYVGRGVDRETKSANVLASVHVPGSNQVRFFTDTGKILVLDYAMPTDGQPQGSWYVWSSASLTSGYGACLLNGIEHHVESDGSVRKEIAGQWVDDANTVILPKITIAPMAFGGVEAWQRVYKGQFLGDFRAAHHLQLTAVYDNGVATQVFADKSVAAGPEALEFRPSRQQLSALEVTIEQLDTGGGTGEGFTFEAIAFVVGMKPGLRRLPTASRL